MTAILLCNLAPHKATQLKRRREYLVNGLNGLREIQRGVGVGLSLLEDRLQGHLRTLI